MNIYSVYIDSSKNNKEIILIKQGYSIIAGFFNIFWAFYHRMWYLAISLFLLSLLLGGFNKTYILYSFNIAMIFIFSFFASELQEYYTVKKGYDLADIVLAANAEEAEVKFFDRNRNLNRD